MIYTCILDVAAPMTEAEIYTAQNSGMYTELKRIEINIEIDK